MNRRTKLLQKKRSKMNKLHKKLLIISKFTATSFLFAKSHTATFSFMPTIGKGVVRITFLLIFFFPFHFFCKRMLIN